MMNISCNKPGHKDIFNPPRYVPDYEKPIVFDAKEYFGDFHSMDPFMGRKAGYEGYWQWPMDFTRGYYYLIKLKPGLILTITDHYSTQPVAVDAAGEDIKNCFVMSFILPSHVSGLFSVEVNEPVKPLVFSPSQAYITYTPDYCGVIRLPGKARFHCIGIVMKPRVVEEFWSGCGKSIPDRLDKVLRSPGSRHHYNQQLTITPLINLRLHEILGCRYQGNTKRFFLESKVLELIVLGFEQLQCNEYTYQCTRGNVNNSDFILQARDILLNNMIDPPSLAEIARQVGVNKTTLNQCFRKIYGVSIFEYLRICRLEMSRDLLQGGKKTVTEIALEVGYSQQSSFTTEFTKYFGQSPKIFLK